MESILLLLMLWVDTQRFQIRRAVQYCALVGMIAEIWRDWASLGSIVFSIVLINRVDDNEDYFEDEDYNMPIYNLCPGCTCQHN